MPGISIKRAVETLELWQEGEGARVILVMEMPGSADMRDGRVQLRRDMRTLVIHSTDETSFVFWPDKFRGCNFVQDEQSGGFAAMRFVGEHGQADVVLLAIAENQLLDIQTLLLLAAQTAGAGAGGDEEPEEELPALAAPEGEHEEETEDSAWKPGRLPYWPPRGEE